MAESLRYSSETTTISSISFTPKQNKKFKVKKKKVKTCNKIRVSILTTPIQYISRNLSPNNQVKKRKGNQTEKKEVKLSPFPDDMISCIQNSKDSNKKMLE